MVSAKVDKSCVVIQYVYAVGGNLAEFRDWEVMVQNLTWILCFSVFLSVVLEIADILLFLCIDRNHWQPLFKKIGSFAVYEFKLLIPVRMGFANLEHFLVCLFAVPQFFQNAADRAEADVYMKFFGKDILDLPQAEGRIRQYFLGVSIGTVVHDFLYMPFDIWDVVLEFFPASPLEPHFFLPLNRLAAVNLFKPLPHGKRMLYK